MPPDASPKTSQVSAPSNDENALEEKKKALEAASAQLSDATSKAANLAAEIKALEARLAEVRKYTDAYSVGAPAQQNDLDGIRKLIAQKWTMAVAGAKDQKDAIDKIVKSADDDIAVQKSKVASTQKSVDKAKQDWDTAVGDTKAKQDTYASLQQPQKDSDAQLKKIKALVDQASKAEAQADVASMYFLLEEASDAMKDVSILPVDEYAAKVKAAQAEADASKANVAVKKSSYDQVLKQLSDLQTSLAVATAARQTTILGKLKDLKKTDAVTTPAATASPAVIAPAPPVDQTPPSTP